MPIHKGSLAYSTLLRLFLLSIRELPFFQLRHPVFLARTPARANWANP